MRLFGGLPVHSRSGMMVRLPARLSRRSEGLITPANGILGESLNALSRSTREHQLDICKLLKNGW